MKKFRSTTAMLAFIMVVNAISYGTIIPLLYPYSVHFGITPMSMGLLLTSYSIAQFIATPILGRLSDRFGRKPLLVLCLVGTAVSLAMFAMAQNIAMLFVARIIDGVTGGNISIAQAIISDTAKGKERAKSFGMIGAAFGFGFLFGPALGGVLGKIGLTAPFWISAAIAAFAAVLCMAILPETLKKKDQEFQKHEPLFRVGALLQALFNPMTGVILLISFISMAGLNSMILGIQTYTVEKLKLSPLEIGLLFSSFGLIGILMQFLAIGPVLKRVASKKRILQFSLAASACSLMVAFFAQDATWFFIGMTLLGIVGAFRDPMITSMISERTRPEDQGIMLGINQSYASLGQIVGPLAASAISAYSLRHVFLLAAVFMGFGALVTQGIGKQHKPLDL